MATIKQVILIRKDLNMRRGKEIAQGSHASMNFLIQPMREQLRMNQELVVELNEQERHWLLHGMAKICLRVNSEQELLELHQLALERGLKSHLIIDSGRTEFHGQATATACAIGPDELERIDAITGTLQLY